MAYSVHYFFSHIKHYQPPLPKFYLSEKWDSIQHAYTTKEVALTKPILFDDWIYLLLSFLFWIKCIGTTVLGYICNRVLIAASSFIVLLIHIYLVDCENMEMEETEFHGLFNNCFLIKNSIVTALTY